MLKTNFAHKQSKFRITLISLGIDRDHTSFKPPKTRNKEIWKGALFFKSIYITSTAIETLHFHNGQA